MDGAGNRVAEKSRTLELFGALCVAAILATFVRTFVAQSYRIPTGSMERSLLVGDHLLVNKFVFGPTVAGVPATWLPVGDIRRGDVIVFKYPQDPHRDFIKRVIALPGETVVLRGKKVYIDGAALDEPYAHFLYPPDEETPPESLLPSADDLIMVPAHQYFVLGDNRDSSDDSRHWGFVPREYVKGRAQFVYFSVDDGRSGGSPIPIRVRWDRTFHQIH